MARPRMDQMRASYDLGIGLTGCGLAAGPAWCAGGGNPELKPWLANGYDLAYEKYFTTQKEHKGYVSAAFFYKDLLSYVYNQNVLFDFAGLPLPPISATQVSGVTYPNSTMGNMNLPSNGEGGLLKGWEYAVSLPLDALWHGLDGFGIQASYSDTQSSIHPSGPTSPDRLPGLSRYISSATLYYEHAGFSVRYSQRTRSSYRGEIRNFSGELNFETIEGEKVQDAQLNYNFVSGSLEGLSLYLQVSNIGDQPFLTTSNDRPLRFFEYGRTTLLGFSYKF